MYFGTTSVDPIIDRVFSLVKVIVGGTKDWPMTNLDRVRFHPLKGLPRAHSWLGDASLASETKRLGRMK